MTPFIFATQPPHLHLALTTLATYLITDGEPEYRLVSYQQPWQHLFTVANKRHLLAADAAMLIQHAAGASYAFLAHVDTGPHQKAEREVEQLLLSLLDLRQRMVLYRQHWPDLLIISTRDRLPLWAHLLLTSSFKRITKPLAGGIATLDALSEGMSIPIWRDLATLALTENPDQTPLIPFSQLLRDPASAALVEQFSQQRHWYQVLLKEAAAPPPRTKQRLGDLLLQSGADDIISLLSLRALRL